MCPVDRNSFRSPSDAHRVRTVTYSDRFPEQVGPTTTGLHWTHWDVGDNHREFRPNVKSGTLRPFKDITNSKNNRNGYYCYQYVLGNIFYILLDLTSGLEYRCIIDIGPTFTFILKVCLDLIRNRRQDVIENNVPFVLSQLESFDSELPKSLIRNRVNFL